MAINAASIIVACANSIDSAADIAGAATNARGIIGSDIDGAARSVLDDRLRACGSHASASSSPARRASPHRLLQDHPDE